MNYQELIDAAYLKYIEGNYNYALFNETLKAKWRRLCLDQQGFLPEARKQIPQAWKLRIEISKSLNLNFLDCSREVLI